MPIDHISTAFVIGAGRMGRRHIEICKRAGLKVIGVFDANIESLRIAQDEYQIEPNYIFNDFDSMCASAIPDYAVVATTTPSHYEFGVAIAKHGVKYLMIEKPFCSSIRKCLDLTSLCEKSGIRLAINHYMRFMPMFEYIHALLMSDSFGGFTSLTVNGGNSGVANLGSHFIDLFNYFSCSSPRDISAWLSDEIVPNPRGEKYVDFGGLIFVQSKNNKRLVIDLPVDQGQGLEILVCGRYGMVRANIMTGETNALVRQEADRDLPLTRSDLGNKVINRNFGELDLVNITASHLKKLVKGGEIVDGRMAMEVISVLAGAHLSNEQNHSTQFLSKLDQVFDREFMWA